MPRHGRTLLPALGALTAGCEGPPEVPESPTWADVEPILRGQCNHCHGATAAQTGTKGNVVYRLDLPDMNPTVCGKAAEAMNLPGLAIAWAKSIQMATTPQSGSRARMPPAPAEALADWERQTLQRWATNPVKGLPPRSNRQPRIKTHGLPRAVVDRLAFTVVLDDPDGESVVGVLQIGDHIVKMDRPGSLAVALDVGRWPPGQRTVMAVLCDGWSSVTYEVGTVDVVGTGPALEPR